MKGSSRGGMRNDGLPGRLGSEGDPLSALYCSINCIDDIPPNRGLRGGRIGGLSSALYCSIKPIDNIPPNRGLRGGRIERPSLCAILFNNIY